MSIDKPGELQELLSIHEAAVVLVDGPEGGAGLVLLPGDHRRGPRARTRPPTLLPSRLLKIILHTATTFSKGHKVFPGKTRMKSWHWLKTVTCWSFTKLFLFLGADTNCYHPLDVQLNMHTCWLFRWSPRSCVSLRVPFH